MHDPYKDLVRNILGIYRQWDGHILRFQQATDIRCPRGCGICCESPSVEATVLECLPLAHAISCRGEAEKTLSAIEERSDQGDPRCVLCRSEGGSPGTGMCAYYPYRVLVCRLFGFSTRRNKRGERELCLCRVLRERHPEASGCLNGTDARALVLPVYQDSFMRIATLGPAMDARLLPINEALRQALEYILWKAPRKKGYRRAA